MSTLIDDKEVVQKGKRPDKLKDVAAPLRDQVPEKLAKKLEEMDIPQKMVKVWTTGNNERLEWLQKQRDLLADWDEFYESSAEGPFEGSSTLHLPMPLIVCKTVHARFNQAILGIEPFFTTKPRREDSINSARVVQDLMGYTLKDWINFRKGVDDVVDAWLWQWITTGSGILKLRWDVCYESFIDVVLKPKIVNEKQKNEKGEEVEVPVQKIVEVEEKVTAKIFEGPVAELKQNEDLLIVGGEGDPQRADVVIDRYYLTASQLWTMADRKVFREEEVKCVIEGGPDYVSGATNSDIKQARQENTGESTLDTEIDADKYEILECYSKLDVDGSGINTEVVMWVAAKSRELLRATYLRRINRAGERPFSKIDYHKRHGQTYGTGLVEMLHPLSVELDAMHNLTVDYGIISTLPFGFYRPTSSIDPEILRLEPGSLIPLDDPQRDVFFPNLGNRTVFGMQQEQSIQLMVERLTGINDMSLGVMSGSQGATRTATGARALLGESNANLDIFLKRLNRGWKSFLQQLLHMLQQRIPQGMSFRVTGDAGDDYWQRIKSEADIAGEFDFEVAPNSAESNRSIQQEVSSQVLQFTQNPLFIQAGIVNSGNIYEAAKGYLRGLGIKDYGRYCTKPPQYNHMLSPEDEANRILRGIPVPVTPEMDHEGFIKYFQEIYKSDELLGQFNEQQTLQLAAQAQKHAAMLEALQAAQAQAANAAQAQMNARNSAQQAPVGQNAMAQETPGANAPQ